MKGILGQHDPEARKRYRDNWDRIFRKGLGFKMPELSRQALEMGVTMKETEAAIATMNAKEPK